MKGIKREWKEHHIYGLSALFILIAAWFSAGYHHIDEHVQILEFAGYKLGLTPLSHLPWEFHAQIRPAIQPLIVVLLSNLLQLFNLFNPFLVAFILRLISGGIAFTAIFLMYQTWKEELTTILLKKWFLYLSFLLWFALYNAVRFSSENLSGSLSLIGLVLLYRHSRPGQLRALGIGIILGISFIIRYQMGFLVIGALGWNLIIRKEIRSGFTMALGILLCIGIGIIIDYWFYQEWTLSIWNYFNQNIIQDKVSGYGIEPWWFYFGDVFLRVIPPYSLILMASCILFFIAYPRHLLSWALIPFLLVHFLIGHKESRFMFPIIGYLPVILVLAFAYLNQKWPKYFSHKRGIRILGKSFLWLNFLILGVAILKPANDQVSLYQKLYRDYPKPVCLHYFSYNPYQYVYFYRRNSLQIKEISKFNDISPQVGQQQLLVVNNKQNLDSLSMKKKLVFTSFPDWAFYFNVNHWIERSNYWLLYELEP